MSKRRPDIPARPDFKKVQQTIELLRRRDQIDRTPAAKAGAMAYQNSVLVQATLPHSNPGRVKAWSRRNGQVKLYVRPGLEEDENGEWREMGVPYGSYPRLVLVWMTTEVVRTKRRKIELGESLSAFMRELGLAPTGGRWGTITRLREQMKRLFHAEIGLRRLDTAHGHEMSAATKPVEEINLWWDPKDPEQQTLWRNTITLSQPFYDALLNGPVPSDMRVLREIKQSALALDLYLWLTYRVRRLDEPLTLSWQQVHDQFGAEYKQVKSFAQQARKQLKRIGTLWPGLRYETPRGRLVLYPGTPHVEEQSEPALLPWEAETSESDVENTP